MVIGNEELSQLFGGMDALPITFVIDRSGHIAMKHEGLISKLTYEEEIGKLLDEPRPEPKRVGELFPSTSLLAFFRAH